MPEIYIALQTLQLFWLIGLTVATWLRKPGLDAAAAASKIETEFARALESHRAETQRELRTHELRLAQIDAHMGHMPDSQSVAELEGTVKQVAERTLGMAERMDGMGAALNRIENFLLNERGRVGGR